MNITQPFMNDTSYNYDYIDCDVIVFMSLAGAPRITFAVYRTSAVTSTRTGT